MRACKESSAVSSAPTRFGESSVLMFTVPWQVCWVRGLDAPRNLWVWLPSSQLNVLIPWPALYSLVPGVQRGLSQGRGLYAVQPVGRGRGVPA